MTAHEEREKLGAWLDGELPEEDARALARHLRTCPDCRTELAQLRETATHVRNLGHEALPPGLAAGIRARLAAEQLRPAPGQARWGREGIRLAASVLLACGLSAALASWLTVQGVRADRLMDDLVNAHLRALVQEAPVQVASSDSHTVRPWFAGKVELAPEARDLAAEGFPLVGGRVDVIAGRRVAVLVYQRRKHLIDVFVWPVGEHPAPVEATRAGYAFRTGRSAGLTYAAVSDLDGDELNRLMLLLQ